MKYLSVCSGIEAATAAWHPIGWEAKAFAEIERFPSAVLAHHYPDVPNLGDMTRYKEWTLDAIDILVGGTPCQSFSIAGLRKGLDDPRGNLMLTYGAIAAHFRPRWIVWENVPGVLSSNRGRDFGTFLGMLALLGYGVAYRILDAQFFGVAQRRRRVFVVGYLGDWRRAAAVLFESESLRWNHPPSRESRKVAPTLPASGAGTGRTGNERTEADFLVMAHGQANAEIREGGSPALTCNHEAPILAVASHWDGDYPHPTLNQSAKGSGGVGASNQELFSQRGAYLVPGAVHAIQAGATRENPNSGPDGIGVQADVAYTIEARAEVQIVAHTLRGEGFDASEDGTGRGTPIVPVAFPANLSGTQVAKTEDLSPSMGAKNPTAVAIQDVRGMDKAQNGKGWSDEGVAFSLDTQATQGIGTGSTVRRLTPRECERLQGFPDDYTMIPWGGKPAEECPDGPRYKAIGNSMAVPVMAWIGKRVQKVEEEIC